MFFKTTRGFLKAPIHRLNINLLATALAAIIIILIRAHMVGFEI